MERGVVRASLDSELGKIALASMQHFFGPDLELNRSFVKIESWGMGYKVSLDGTSCVIMEGGRFYDRINARFREYFSPC